MDLYEIINAEIIAAYYKENKLNNKYTLGNAFFPKAKRYGLNLEWLKGEQQKQKGLEISAFDTKPNVRERNSFTDVKARMPFFREAMTIGEEERQMIMSYKNVLENPYLDQVLEKIFDDTTTLVTAANLQTERMRASLLQNAKIEMTNVNSNGSDATKIKYNYDPKGVWAQKNKTPFKAAKPWTDTTSTPVTDIQNLVTKASAEGVKITTAIINISLFNALLQNTQIKNDMKMVATTGDPILTPQMLANYFSSKMNIKFIVSSDTYIDDKGANKYIVDETSVIFTNGESVGKTWYGTTPEEIDLKTTASGDRQLKVEVVDTGVAITTYKEFVPVNIVTSVSQIVLPSYEKMSTVYNIPML